MENLGQKRKWKNIQWCRQNPFLDPTHWDYFFLKTWFYFLLLLRTNSKPPIHSLLFQLSCLEFCCVTASSSISNYTRSMSCVKGFVKNLTVWYSYSCSLFKALSYVNSQNVTCLFTSRTKTHNYQERRVSASMIFDGGGGWDGAANKQAWREDRLRRTEGEKGEHGQTALNWLQVCLPIPVSCHILHQLMFLHCFEKQSKLLQYNSPA